MEADKKKIDGAPSAIKTPVVYPVCVECKHVIKPRFQGVRYAGSMYCSLFCIHDKAESKRKENKRATESDVAAKNKKNKTGEETTKKKISSEDKKTMADTKKKTDTDSNCSKKVEERKKMLREL